MVCNFETGFCHSWRNDWKTLYQISIFATLEVRTIRKERTGIAKPFSLMNIDSPVKSKTTKTTKKLLQRCSEAEENNTKLAEEEIYNQTDKMKSLKSIGVSFHCPWIAEV